ncbi:MAG: hypothetical protein EXR72_06375 [Myxococcales bacterium]|nr:hypothetical protein [Myxococcales bacterium]
MFQGRESAARFELIGEKRVPPGGARRDLRRQGEELDGAAIDVELLVGQQGHPPLGPGGSVGRRNLLRKEARLPSLRTGRLRLRLRLRLRDEQEPARGPPPLSSTRSRCGIVGGDGDGRRAQASRAPLVAGGRLRDRRSRRHPLPASPLERAVSGRLALGACAGLLAGSVSALATPLPGDRTSELRFAPTLSLPLRGPRYSAVTIDLYLPLPVPSSVADAMPLLRRLANAGEARLSVHLASNGSPASVAQVEALLEAARQERFFPLVDALCARGAEVRASPPSTEELVRVGRDAGLIGEHLAAALLDHRHRGEALRLTAETRASGRGGNDLWVNGVRVPVRTSELELLRTIEGERQSAQALLDAGVPLTRLHERLVEEREELRVAAAQGGRGRLTVDLVGSPARGPEMAPVTLVMFCHLLATPCVALAATARRLEERFPRSIRLVWKHLPGTSSGQQAAEFAAAAHAQGGFWKLYDLALVPSTVAIRTGRDLLAHCATAGLDVARVEREVKAGEHRPLLQRDTNEARRLNIPWPGSAIINGILVPGSQPYEVYERLVQRQIAAGLLQRLTGR